MAKTIKRLFFSLLIGIIFTLSYIDAATVKAVSFNILAPPWAKLSSYPESSWPYIDREYRRAQIIATLNSIKDSTDVIALQEVTSIEFGYIKNALKDFIGFESFHDPSYWSQYITENPPWEPNGNAILLKKSAFRSISFSDVALSESGNHAAYAQATHKATNKPFRFLSVHFDSDHGGNRNQESAAALDLLSPQSGTVDIIIGDFNSSPQQGNYANEFENAGFIDVLFAIGNTDLTTPFAQQYSSSNNFETIDHFTARNATPISGDVIDLNLFVTYPPVPAYEDTRVTEGMRLLGSDHFPIYGTIDFN